MAGINRVISVTLDDAEWRAFLAVQPQPVAWLKQQIREQLQAARVETEDRARSQSARAAVN